MHYVISDQILYLDHRFSTLWSWRQRPRWFLWDEKVSWQIILSSNIEKFRNWSYEIYELRHFPTFLIFQCIWKLRVIRSVYKMLGSEGCTEERAKAKFFSKYSEILSSLDLFTFSVFLFQRKFQDLFSRMDGNKDGQVIKRPHLILNFVWGKDKLTNWF